MKTRRKFQVVARKEEGNQPWLGIFDNHNYDTVAALSALTYYGIAAMILEEIFKSQADSFKKS